MKIAIFTDTYSPEINGVVTSINNFSRILASRGHEIIIFAPKYKNYVDIHEKNIKIVRFPAVSFASNKATKVAFPRIIELMTKLRRFKPDVIHIQTPSTLGIVGIMMSKALRIPNIQTYHTYLPEIAIYFDVAKVFGLEKIPELVDSSKFSQRLMTTDFYDFLMKKTKSESLAEFIGFKNDQTKKPNYDLTIKALWIYTRWVYNRADLVLSPSGVLARDLKWHRIKPAVDVQSNGVEIDKIPVKKDYTPTGKVIHYGRLGFEKKTDIILKAFAEVLKKYPGATLDIAGDGPAKKSLEQLAQKLGISGSVKFLGFMERTKILKILKKYDVFVTASPMETQGLVILEAMAAGLPAIGVNKLAVPEVIKNKQNGFIVPPLNYKKMAEKIGLLVSDDQLREKMGQRSVALAGEHELTKMADKLEKTYQKIAK